MKRKLLMIIIAIFAISSVNAQSLGLANQVKSKANDVDVFSKGMDHMSTVKGTLFFDNFTTLSGWTMEGLWGIGAATVEPIGDHTQNGDNMIMGGPLNADYPASSPEYNSTSPVIDCSAQTAVTLSFWSFSGCENNSWDHVGIEVWDGDAWVSIYANGSTSYQETVWTYYEYDVTEYAAGNANFQVRFYYGPTDTSVQYSGWAIDDFSITFPEPHDLGVDAIVPTFVLSGETVTPQVTVHNYGSSEETVWSVTLSDGDGYSETVSNPGTIAVASDYVVDFPDWSPADGSYTLTATVTVADDANTDNDMLEVACDVIVATLSYTVNAEATGNEFASLLLPMGVETPIGAFSATNFPMAMEYAADGNYYIIRNSPATLSTVDITTGAETVIGTMSGMSGTPTGLAYDWDNDIMYICVLNGSSLPQLGTIDLTTAVATLIGTGAAGMLIAIEFDNEGNLYGPSLSPDELYQIDLTTGATTSIGSLGVDLNYGQDISFDKASGIMYGTLYDAAVGGVLSTIDLTTGAVTELVVLTDQHACFAIPYEAAQNGAPITFVVDNTANTDFTGFALKGSWDADGNYDAAWNGGAEHADFYDDGTHGDETAGDEIWSVLVYLVPDGGTNTWEWGVNDQDGNWIDGNFQFTVADETPQTLTYATVGVKNLIGGINIYPNPSKGLININVENTMKLEVLDITGKLIQTMTINDLSSIQINTAGIYFLRFSNEEGSSVQRVVVK